MKYYNGFSECPEHGQFKWDGYITNSDYRFGTPSEINKKLNIITKNNKKYVVVCCPKCHKPIEIPFSSLKDNEVQGTVNKRV